jgi:hypothetical protein
MVQDSGRAREDYDSFRLLVDLWAGENPVKTGKLLVLLAVNAILVSALCMAGGLEGRNWPIPLAGAAFSLVLFLSLGRTSLSQESWKRQIRELSGRYPEDSRFHLLDGPPDPGKAHPLLRALGSIPSRYYLLGAPALLVSAWTGALVYLLS